MESILEARDLCVRYHGHQALDHVDLRVAPGEVVNVLGPNGSGKTTFLRAALGLLKPHCGEVRLFGLPPTSRRARRRIAYVPQHAVHVDPLFPATAYEVVLTGRVGKDGVLGRLRGGDHEAAKEAMEEVGVWDLKDRTVGRLSGGQRQRVFLARAVAQEPELLILDEPTSGVDPDARAGFYGLLQHLNTGHGMALVVVTHDPHPMRSFAHRYVVLDRAKQFDGTPEAFDAWMGEARLRSPIGPWVGGGKG